MRGEQGAVRVQAAGREGALDADHVRSEVGEDARDQRADPALGQRDDRQLLEEPHLSVPPARRWALRAAPRRRPPGRAPRRTAAVCPTASLRLR